MTHYTRAQWGARPARGGPGQLYAPDVDGIALHWPAMSRPLTTVAAVMAALRGWQNYHMDGQGWSDIGYQVAVDQAGNRYELRGLHIQSGANGDAAVNEQYGAVLLVLAPGEEPSDALVAETRRVIGDHRALYRYSDLIVGHADIRPEPTSCPGPAVLAGIRAGLFNPEEDDMFTDDDRELLERIDRKVDRDMTRDTNRHRRLAGKLDRLITQGNATREQLVELRADLDQEDTQ